MTFPDGSEGADYPRPAPPSPPRPYPLDRTVAIVFAALVLLSTVLWLWGLFHRPDAGPILRRWWGYYVAYLSTLILYGWTFYAYARSRHWAFVTTLFFVCLSVLGSVLDGNVARAAIAFVLFAYSIARLFGMLGPKPLRRLDLIAR